MNCEGKEIPLQFQNAITAASPPPAYGRKKAINFLWSRTVEQAYNVESFQEREAEQWTEEKCECVSLGWIKFPVFHPNKAHIWIFENITQNDKRKQVTFCNVILKVWRFSKMLESSCHQGVG